MSNWVGICKKVLSDGSVDHVVVRDSTGMEMAFEPEIYRQRGITPDIESLPICGTRTDDVEDETK